MEAKVTNLKTSQLELNTGQIPGVPKNPRFIRDNRFAALKKSIEDAPEMLTLRELIVYPLGKKYVVICGNMRLRACREIGYKELPCKVLQEDTPPEKLREYAIKDNNGFGEDDWDLLANEWDADELKDWGVELPTEWGEVEGEADETESADVEPNEEVESIVKNGDVWILGEHRLMCGDSFNKEDIEILLNGENAILTLTDPPYSLKTEGGGILKQANSMKQIKTNKVDEFDPLNLELYSETNIYTHNKPLIKDYILLAEKK